MIYQRPSGRTDANYTDAGSEVFEAVGSGLSSGDGDSAAAATVRRLPVFAKKLCSVAWQQAREDGSAGGPSASGQAAVPSGGVDLKSFFSWPASGPPAEAGAAGGQPAVSGAVRNKQLREGVTWLRKTPLMGNNLYETSGFGKKGAQEPIERQHVANEVRTLALGRSAAATRSTATLRLRGTSVFRRCSSRRACIRTN